jgi:hypothetical protein
LTSAFLRRKSGSAKDVNTIDNGIHANILGVGPGGFDNGEGNLQNFPGLLA